MTTHFKLTIETDKSIKDLSPQEILDKYTSSLREQTGDNNLVLYALVYTCDFCHVDIDTSKRKYYECQECNKVYDYCEKCTAKCCEKTDSIAKDK